MPIEIGPSSPGSARAVGAVDPLAARAALNSETHANAAARGAGPALDHQPLDPGHPPVDAERVAQIRKAVESGHYPVLPAKIADAMIAAGIFLRTGQ